MMEILALQELPVREKEDDSNSPVYSGTSWQNCL
jgi:hypothetical protein